jgi:sulfur relay (sulfurtransferase) DsrF/TusC family protein
VTTDDIASALEAVPDWTVQAIDDGTVVVAPDQRRDAARAKSLFALMASYGFEPKYIVPGSGKIQFVESDP